MAFIPLLAAALFAAAAVAAAWFHLPFSTFTASGFAIAFLWFFIYEIKHGY